MKIGIHKRKGSFSDQWIEYCNENKIDYKEVNCYDSDIVAQLSDCDALMWHHNHTTYQDILLAKALLFSLEQSGKKVFPNFKTNWHFDDKVGQKYLLESIDAPLIPSYAYYDKGSALRWVNSTTFPKVFKLRGGSGASQVTLVRDKKSAIKMIDQAFGKGFSKFNSINLVKEKYRKFREGKDSYFSVVKALGRMIVPPEFAKMTSPEKGYVYFQDFLPNNTFDIRLIVIQDKAYGMKRLTRENDFRASGSSNFVYDPIPNEILTIGFEVSKKLGLQCVAFDFVYNELKKPLIVEISYGFGTKGSSLCPGYWDESLNWFQGKFNPQGWMVENLIKSI